MTSEEIFAKQDGIVVVFKGIKGGVLLIKEPMAFEVLRIWLVQALTWASIFSTATSR